MQIDVARCECNLGVRQSFQLVVLHDVQKRASTVALHIMQVGVGLAHAIILLWRRASSPSRWTDIGIRHFL